MQTSRDRILTTHTGSLPRPPGLRDLLVKKDQGEPYDTAELQRQTSAAVAAIVKRQAEAGVDVINDGEMSKPGYSTYVADRLSGFAGHEPAKRQVLVQVLVALQPTPQLSLLVQEVGVDDASVERRPVRPAVEQPGQPLRLVNRQEHREAVARAAIGDE